MKHCPILVFHVIILAFACTKQPETPIQPPQRELSIPEKTEKEIMEVLSKDWKSLSDTLDYFYATMLSKGKLKGKAPDGIYYEMGVRMKKPTGVETYFIVKDSTWATLTGQFIPLGLSLAAFDTKIALREEANDSTSLSIAKVKVTAPPFFLICTDRQAPIYFEGAKVGYFTRETFENTDYSVGTYLVAHYYGDNRTFAIYDNGLLSLLKKKLPDEIR